MPKSTRITLNIEPRVGKNQRVVLFLNEFQSSGKPKAYSIELRSREEDTNTINIPTDVVELGDYLVRVQVDGAESILGVDKNRDSDTFEQYVEPRVKFE
jgi:hypothetical protein